MFNKKRLYSLLVSIISITATISKPIVLKDTSPGITILGSNPSTYAPLPITGINNDTGSKTGETGNYFRSSKKAIMRDGTIYTNIIEYSAATTPPNIYNNKLVSFATMPNPDYITQPAGMVGGPSKNTILYGIPLKTRSHKESISFKGKNKQTGQYFPTLQQATINQKNYINVIEHQSTYAPLPPAFKKLGTMSNPDYDPSKRLLGGNNKTIELWGLPVSGKKINIVKKQADKTKIGTYWSEQSIAQLNNGHIFVDIIATPISSIDSQPNVYEMYQTDEHKAILKKYGISTGNIKQRIQKIGCIKQPSMSMIAGAEPIVLQLYGVSIQSQVPTIIAPNNKTSEKATVSKKIFLKQPKLSSLKNKYAQQQRKNVSKKEKTNYQPIVNPYYILN